MDINKKNSIMETKRNFNKLVAIKIFENVFYFYGFILRFSQM